MDKYAEKLQEDGVTLLVAKIIRSAIKDLYFDAEPYERRIKNAKKRIEKMKSEPNPDYEKIKLQEKKLAIKEAELNLIEYYRGTAKAFFTSSDLFKYSGVEFEELEKHKDLILAQSDDDDDRILGLTD